MKLKILYEDKYIIGIEKAPGMPVQSDKTGDEDLQSAVESYAKYRYGSSYAGLVQRLDRPVGGVIIYALTEFANRELSKQIQNRETDKYYLAVASGGKKGQSAILEDYIKKLKTINMSKISVPEDKQAKYAKLSYEIIETEEDNEFGTLSLLKVKLYTGRHHQIRIQLSNAGLPIWGDNKYNKIFVKKKEWTQIALWSHKMIFKHPKTKQLIEITSMPDNVYPFDIFKDMSQQKIYEVNVERNDEK